MATDRSYADFDLAVERAPGGGYRARVVDSPAGEASGEFKLPFSELEIENFLLKVGRPTRGTRRLESPEMEAARVFGGGLYEAVFQDDVRLSLRRSLDEAERRNEGLRIRLRLGDVPELANLPWEYLFNRSADRFLVLSTWTPIIRYVDLPQPITPLQVDGPIRILALISAPRDYPTLDVEQEWSRCRQALEPLIEEGSVAIDLVENATLLELQRTLRRNEYHIFHYVGHGGFDKAADDGVLVLEDGQNRSRVVSGRDIGTILHDHRSLRMAVLNACEGARSSVDDPFSGVAQSLVRQGIPSVVAMQFEITDDAAIAFAQEFYAAVSDGYPVDAAISEARRAIFGLGNDIEWGTPVLYMRTQNGRLFDVSRERPAAPVETPDDDPTPQPTEVIESPPATAAAATAVDTPTRETEAEPVPVPSDIAEQAPDGPDAQDTSSSVGTIESEPVDAGHPDATSGETPIGRSEASAGTPTDTVEPDTASRTVTGRGRDREPSDGGSGRPPPWVYGAAAAGIVILLIVLISMFTGGGNETGETTTTAANGTTTSAVTTTAPLDPILAPDGSATATFTAEPKRIDASPADWDERIVHETPHVIFTDRRIGDEVARIGTDATAEVRLAWDAEALYVLAVVEDDIHSQPNDGNQIWRGDAIDLNIDVLDATGEAPASPGPHDFQITLSPGDPAASTPSGSVLFVGNGERFFDNRTGIATVGAVVDRDGYVLEAAIPWDEIGVSGPTAGTRFALIIAVFDNDGETFDGNSLQTVILANTPGAGFQQPNTWGSLTLEE